MLGQDKLIKKLNTLTIDTLPHSIMLIGDEGCGKHTLCGLISKKFNLPINDISEKLNLETMNEITLKVEPSLYIIDGANITVREEGVILKFLEEPLKNAFIVILCENKGYMLNTIINRCNIWEFAPYTRECLNQFTMGDDTLFSIATTPGQVLECANQPIKDMVELGNKILDKIYTANFANTLTLTNKVAFKDEATKYNYKVFFKVLLNCAHNNVINNKADNCFNVYSLTNKLVNESHIPHIDEEKLFENYLCNLRTLG